MANRNVSVVRVCIMAALVLILVGAPDTVHAATDVEPPSTTTTSSSGCWRIGDGGLPYWDTSCVTVE